MTDAELTRLAAEKVMGWTAFPMRDENGKFVDGYDTASRPKLIENVRGEWIAHRENGEATRWKPLTDWRAAGEIIEKMRADGWEHGAQTYGKDYDASFSRPLAEDEEPQIEGSELFVASWLDTGGPRAITIAALRAVGAIAEEGGAE